MATPDMAAVTASLQKSLQNCSLNNQQSSGEGGSSSSSSSSTADQVSDSPPPPAVDLNSESSLPLHWEQCLDLKTGEIYFINWRTGMKVKEDPRRAEQEADSGSSCEDSVESEEESSPYGVQGQCDGGGVYSDEKIVDDGGELEDLRMSVLVVAGCKSCLMYYMVPKRARACPKCSGQLLHFDRAASSP